MPLLKQFFDSRIPLEAAHRETMRRLRLYMLVGGMPQASRYQVASVLDDSERKNIMGILEEMKDSMVVNFAYHANDSNVGLAINFIIILSLMPLAIKVMKWISFFQEERKFIR